MIHRNDNGFTIGELKELLKDFKDDGEVWLGVQNEMTSNECTEISRLNENDIILEPRNEDMQSD